MFARSLLLAQNRNQRLYSTCLVVIGRSSWSQFQCLVSLMLWLTFDKQLQFKRMDSFRRWAKRARVYANEKNSAVGQGRVRRVLASNSPQPFLIKNSHNGSQWTHRHSRPVHKQSLAPTFTVILLLLLPSDPQKQLSINYVTTGFCYVGFGNPTTFT